MPKRSRFSLAFKLKVLKAYDTTKSFNKVSKDFKIDRRIIREWMKQRSKMKETRGISSRMRLQSRLRPGFPDLEKRVADWIREMRQKGYIIDGNLIKTHALHYANEMGINNFRCSDGWLNRFLKRNRLSLRRVTTSGRDLPSNSVEIIVGFMDGCSYQILANNFDSNRIINMDQTSIYLDSFCMFFIIKKLIFSKI